jgi:hypothetical protein
VRPVLTMQDVMDIFPAHFLPILTVSLQR